MHALRGLWHQKVGLSGQLPSTAGSILLRAVKGAPEESSMLLQSSRGTSISKGKRDERVSQDLNCSRLLLRRASKLEVGGIRILCQVASGIEEALNLSKCRNTGLHPTF